MAGDCFTLILGGLFSSSPIACLLIGGSVKSFVPNSACILVLLLDRIGELEGLLESGILSFTIVVIPGDGIMEVAMMLIHSTSSYHSSLSS